MHLPIKLNLGILGSSAILIPGSWMLLTAEPSYTTVAQDSSLTEYENKFGSDFKYHLVSTQNDQNISWWNWSFSYRWKKDDEANKSSDFKEITDGATLKSKCSELYKKVNTTDIHANGKEQDEKSVWRYCSLEGEKPTTVKESKEKESGTSDADSAKIGKANDSSLISTLDPKNNLFWYIQEQAFFKETSGLGSKSTSDTSFKKLYDNKTRTPSDTLRETCKNAYNKDTKTQQMRKKMLLFSVH